MALTVVYIHLAKHWVAQSANVQVLRQLRCSVGPSTCRPQNAICRVCPPAPSSCLGASVSEYCTSARRELPGDGCAKKEDDPSIVDDPDVFGNVSSIGRFVETPRIRQKHKANPPEKKLANGSDTIWRHRRPFGGEDNHSTVNGPDAFGNVSNRGRLLESPRSYQKYKVNQREKKGTASADTAWHRRRPLGDESCLEDDPNGPDVFVNVSNEGQLMESLRTYQRHKMNPSEKNGTASSDTSWHRKSFGDESSPRANQTVNIKAGQDFSSPAVAADCSSSRRDDPADVFGTLDPDSRFSSEELVLDKRSAAALAADMEEGVPITKTRRMFKTSTQYGREILRLIEQRKLGDAIALLKRMTDVDHVKPDSFVYNCLIDGCGIAGYTAMAFHCYNEMKRRALKVTAMTYVGLFNACANSPWPEDGLARARKLYAEITEKGVILNYRNYHCMIKAFGRCGDLRMALGLADEMVDKGVPINQETFSFLLSACATDRNVGFLHAIMVWRKMREKRIAPSVYNYNLLLRIVHDCGVGDHELAATFLLGSTSRPSPQSSGITPPPLRLVPVGAGSPSEAIERSQAVESETALVDTLTNPPALPKLPDLLSPRCIPHDVVSLQSADQASNRLLLLGGMQGVMERMRLDGVKPDVKTFTQLIETIPSKRKEEGALLDAMKQAGVKPDIDLFNVLIKKRCTRHDYAEAKNTLTLIATENLEANIATFGTLAMTCNNFTSAREFLSDMEATGFRPNIQILGCLVNNACHRKDFWFLLDTMNRFKTEEIHPNPKVLTRIEKCIVDTKKFMVEQEKLGKRFDSTDVLSKSFGAFMMSYRQWLQALQVEMPDHPWQQYRQTSEQNETASSKT